MRALAAVLALAACVPAEPPEVSGRAVFQADCAACHGADARGAGPLAGGLAVRPPDLTRIAARSGGAFDRVAVMTQIDGYFRDVDPAHPMPEFGAALDGPMMPVETAPGVFTPTPAGLVALADWLEGVQR
jgi:mono/diheme cytochrome c family protein